MIDHYSNHGKYTIEKCYSSNELDIIDYAKIGGMFIALPIIIPLSFIGYVLVKTVLYK